LHYFFTAKVNSPRRDARTSPRKKGDTFGAAWGVVESKREVSNPTGGGKVQGCLDRRGRSEKTVRVGKDSAGTKHRKKKKGKNRVSIMWSAHDLEGERNNQEERRNSAICDKRGGGKAWASLPNLTGGGKN